VANVVTLGPGKSIAVLASAARTTAPDTFEFRDLGRAVGVVVVVDCTAKTSSPSLTVTVSGVDGFTDKTWTLVASAAITGTGTTILKVRPGITAVSNVSVADVLPPAFRITCAHGNTDSITYSVSAYLVN